MSATDRQSIKKKTHSGLRAKSTKKASVHSKISEFREENAAVEHENPLLKLLKVSKKEKQQTRSDEFTQRLLQKRTFNLSGGVSKSTRKRQNRKKREQLKPKMDDLFSALPDVVNVVEAASVSGKKKFVAGTAKNLPNPQKQTGHSQIMKQELLQFTQVLRNEQFKQSPFEALKQAILNNMKS